MDERENERRKSVEVLKSSYSASDYRPALRASLEVLQEAQQVGLLTSPAHNPVSSFTAIQSSIQQSKH